MRVVLTHPYCFPYVRRGTERNIDGLARYLHGQGHEVTLVSTSPDGPRAEQGPGGRRILHRPRWNRWLGALRIEPPHTFYLDCRRSLTELRPDVVHSFYFFDALAAAALRERLGYGTVLQMNGAPVPEAFHRLFPPDRWLIRRALAASRRRIVCSEFVGALVRDHYGLGSTAIVPGIDLDEFGPGAGPADGVPTLLAVGNFDLPRKGLRVLIEAFRLVRQSCPTCRLRVSGSVSDGLRTALTTGLAAGVRHAIEFLGLGDLREVPGQYQGASLLVVPSVWEPSGTVMMEAWACGTPVVAANHGGLPEFLDPAVGRLYEPGIANGESTAAPALAAAILAGLELAADRRIRARCREYAGRFAWQRIGPRIIEQYEQSRDAQQ